MLLQKFKQPYLMFFANKFHLSSFLFFKPECTIEKRSRMLSRMIENSKTKKHWNPQAAGSSVGAPSESIYNKVPRPHKRASVLNSLFMNSITDVMSTGDVCTEIMGQGVEITGVRVTNDYQIVNVYWQISDSADAINSHVEGILAKNATKIRRELISRNLLGKVPRLYFIRDPTNKRASDFQRCLELSGVSEMTEPPSQPVEELMKNLYNFGVRDSVKKMPPKVEIPKVVPDAPLPMPEKPPDMRFDVMGLDYEHILSKVMERKRKQKRTQSSSFMSHSATGTDVKNVNIIDSIPAIPLSDIDREKQMKKFIIDRKTKWATTIKQNAVENSTFHSTASDILEDIMGNENFEDEFADDYEFEDDYEDSDNRIV